MASTMDLRHLQTFLRVCKHRSLSAAAHELGLSQPALSKIVRRLEQELGVQLFERLPRGMEPTQYARILEEAARQLEANYRGAIRQIDSFRDGLSGEIAVGAGNTWRDEFLPSAVARFLEKHPAARVRLEGGASSDALVAALVDGRIDIALAVVAKRGALDQEVVAETLMSDRLVVACRQDHPGTHSADSSVIDLASLRWAVARGPTALARFRRVFLDRGIEPPLPVLESEDINCVLDVVAASDLVAYVPRVRVLSRRARDLGIIRSTQAEAQRDTGAYFRRSSFVSPLCRDFLQEVRGVVEQRLGHAQ
jgi:LysR family transcriptional regulator of gallate degradation